ncbi:alpha/beta hydrolase [Pseudomonas capsici]|nr:alpha/beta hydrolase [Pseudomonas capsici]MCV4340612.1 alpha/beta hydrolase [Pseudomonas capsici]
MTCGCDPLEDEGRAYSKRLQEAGVTVTHSHVRGRSTVLSPWAD